MPKIITSVLRAQLQLLRPLLAGLSIEECRKYQDRLGELGLTVYKSRLVCRDVAFESFSGSVITPRRGGTSDRCVLYLHGGSYTAGSLAYARGFGGVLADKTHASVLCAAYRLAPEHPFPAGLEDATEAYRYLLRRHTADKIYVVGESAGGGLCLSLMQRLGQLGLPQPAGAVVISPWTDLTFTSKSYETNKKKDPTLSEEALRVSASLYCPTNRADPLVSPLFGELHSLPRTLIFVGSHELLLDDSTRLHDALLEAGVDSELYISEGMWHAYVLFGVPEAKEATDRISRFINE